MLNKVPESGNDYFRSETSDWNNLFRLGPRRSALANLPEDEDKFPVSIWFRRLLLEGTQRLALNSAALRRPSPPGSPRRFLPDGSNLPWVVCDLEENSAHRLREWIDHVRTAVPDLRAIRTVERPEDRHRHLVVDYDTGLSAPSWLVSDGTLRMLALTVLAYLPNLQGIYLIEEPENGIHPRAVETVLRSLSSVYGAQVLLATHSPVILSLTRPEQVLCFGQTDEGATDIVRGSEHPRLRTWRQETDHEPSLRAWLETNGHWPTDAGKPPRPKKALEAALREVRKPRSSAIYRALAKSVSLGGHSEPSFLRFTQALQTWFPP